MTSPHRFEFVAPRHFGRTVSDDNIWKLWQIKYDTNDIARLLQTPEWNVHNRLMHIREEKRKNAEWDFDAGIKR